MRARLPLAVLALTMLFALVASGCGDDKSSSNTATPPGATQSVVPDPETSGSTGSTGSNSSATESATAAYNACVSAAKNLPDADTSRKAQKQCKDSYDNIKDSTAKIDEQTSEARDKCNEAANKIPDSDTKTQALAACDKFR